jgi:hypothetical protein
LLPLGCVAEEMLQLADLNDPDKLISYRKQVSVADRELSKKMYQHGEEASKNDFAAAFKAFGESALIYPNSPALAKMAEYRLKMVAKKNLDVQRDALGEVSNYISSAIALNKVDKQLNETIEKQIVQDKLCLDRYLKTEDLDDQCRPLRWIDMVE